MIQPRVLEDLEATGANAQVYNHFIKHVGGKSLWRRIDGGLWDKVTPISCPGVRAAVPMTCYGLALSYHVIPEMS